MLIPTACPHCGKSVRVSHEYAGQTGPCPHCQGIITVPDGPVLPETELRGDLAPLETEKSTGRLQFTLNSLLLLVLLVALILSSCKLLNSLGFFAGSQWIGGAVSAMVVFALLALAARVNSRRVATVLGACAGCAAVAYPAFLWFCVYLGAGYEHLGSPYLLLAAYLSFPAYWLAYFIAMVFTPVLSAPTWVLRIAFMVTFFGYWAVLGILAGWLVHWPRSLKTRSIRLRR